MFAKGFEKQSMDLSRVAKSGMKMLKSPSVARAAVAGAGTGAIAGAVSDKDNRVGGAVKGALLGGALGGGAGAAMRANKANTRVTGMANRAHAFKYGGGGNGN